MIVESRSDASKSEPGAENTEPRREATSQTSTFPNLSRSSVERWTLQLCSLTWTLTWKESKLIPHKWSILKTPLREASPVLIRWRHAINFWFVCSISGQYERMYGVWQVRQSGILKSHLCLNGFFLRLFCSHYPASTITLHCNLAGFNNNSYKFDQMSIDKYGGVSKDFPIKWLNLVSLSKQKAIFAKNKGRGLHWTQK